MGNCESSCCGLIPKDKNTKNTKKRPLISQQSLISSEYQTSDYNSTIVAGELSHSNTDLNKSINLANGRPNETSDIHTSDAKTQINSQSTNPTQINFDTTDSIHNKSIDTTNDHSLTPKQKQSDTKLRSNNDSKKETKPPSLPLTYDTNHSQIISEMKLNESEQKSQNEKFSLLTFTPKRDTDTTDEQKVIETNDNSPNEQSKNSKDAQTKSVQNTVIAANTVLQSIAETQTQSNPISEPPKQQKKLSKKSKTFSEAMNTQKLGSTNNSMDIRRELQESKQENAEGLNHKKHSSTVNKMDVSLKLNAEEERAELWYQTEKKKREAERLRKANAENAAKLKVLFEAKKRREEEERLRAERQALDDERARKERELKAKQEKERAEAERIRKEKECEAIRLREEEAEALRIKAEQEKKMAEDERIKREEETEVLRLKAEESELVRIEQARIIKEKECEAQRLKAEQEKQKAEEERMKLANIALTAKLKAEQTEKERLRQEQEQIIKAQQAEIARLRLLDEEQKRREAEAIRLKEEESQRLRAEQERINREEEAEGVRVKVEQEKQRAEEQRIGEEKEAEAARLKAEEEQRLKAEQEKQKAEEERIKIANIALAAKLKAEQTEKERLRQEQEQIIKSQQAEIARFKSEESERLIAEEEERIRKAEAIRLKEEENERLRAEQERIKREEESEALTQRAEEQRIKRETDAEAARLKAEEEQRLRAEQKKQKAEEERIKLANIALAAKLKAEQNEKERLRQEQGQIIKEKEAEIARLRSISESERLKAEETKNESAEPQSLHLSFDTGNIVHIEPEEEVKYSYSEKPNLEISDTVTTAIISKTNKNFSEVMSETIAYNENEMKPLEMESLQTFDFSVFRLHRKKSAQELFTQTNWERLSVGLKYYETKCSGDSQSEIDKQAFVEFCTLTYPQFLNDFIQFIQEHVEAEQLTHISNELQEKHGFTQCELSNCDALKRHYQQQFIYGSDDNYQFNFYRRCYDRLHHYIFHLSQMGLRIESTAVSLEGKEAMQDIHSACVDQEFGQKRDLIRQRRVKCGLNLARFHDPNNKYHLLVSNKSQTATTEEATKNGNTFLDEMFGYIDRENRSKEITALELSLLAQFICENEYDSDAMREDATMAKSNLKQFIHNDLCSYLMCDYIRRAKLAQITSFSTGFVFYYWKVYKAMKPTQIQRYDQNFKAKINNGYSIAELLITAHYSTLKEEATQTRWISMDDWHKKITFKAAQYHSTFKAKKMKAGRRVDYGMKPLTPISLAHLQCIILYCDWDDLCWHFRATFHKSSDFETLENLKIRHSKYYHFARGLVEAVNNFGLTGSFVGTGSPNTERGPFYCGLPTVQCVPTTSIYLKGPCSTSKSIETMVNFSSHTGIIVELQNDEFGQAAKQRFFDCSWVSNFAEDSERLFIAGSFRLKIASIRIVRTAQNLAHFFKAFHSFDRMISDSVFINRAIVDDIAESGARVLHRMVRQRLDKSKSAKNDKFEKYAEDTFDLICFAKTEIKLNLYYLDTEYKNLSDLVIDSVSATKRHRYSRRSKEWQSEEQNANASANLLNTKLFALFPNLRRVEIDTTFNSDVGNTHTHWVYAIDLLRLLPLIESANEGIKYVIVASQKAEKSGGTIQPTWINTDVKDAFFTIKRAFKQKRWNIHISAEETKKGKFGKLIIQKIKTKSPRGQLMSGGKSLHYLIK